MYAKGSANSSQLGSNTGHSGGGMNSFSGGWVIFASLFSDSKQKYVVQGASSPHCNRAGGEILSISPCPLFPHWTQRRNYLVGGGGAREWQSVHCVPPLEKVDTLYLGYSALSRTHSMKKHLFFCRCYFFLIIFFLMSVRRVNSPAQIGVFFKIHYRSVNSKIFAWNTALNKLVCLRNTFYSSRNYVSFALFFWAKKILR